MYTIQTIFLCIESLYNFFYLGEFKCQLWISHSSYLRMSLISNEVSSENVCNIPIIINKKLIGLQ